MIQSNKVQFTAETSSPKQKGSLSERPSTISFTLANYNVDSISKPQASSKGSGMYFEFLLRRAHSRRRVERKYCTGESLYSRTTCSNLVVVGGIVPVCSRFPPLGVLRCLCVEHLLFTSRGIS